MAAQVGYACAGTFLTDMVSLMDESLTGIKILKGGTMRPTISAISFTISTVFLADLAEHGAAAAVASPTSEFPRISAAAVLMVYGGSLVLSGDLEASAFVAYLSIFTQITRPLAFVYPIRSRQHQPGDCGGERVVLLDEKSKITNAPDAVRMTDCTTKSSSRARFSYDNKRGVILRR